MVAEPGDLRLVHLSTYCGPNPHAPAPLVVAELLVSAVESAAPKRCEMMAEAGRAWSDSAEAPRGNSAVELGRFLAKWTLALLNEGGALLDEAGAVEDGGRLLLHVGYRHPQLSRAALDLAVDVFLHIESAPREAIERRIDEFLRLTRQAHPDFQIAYLIKGAKAHGLPYLPFQASHRVWQFGWGCRRRLFFECEPQEESAIGWKIARDKLASKEVFAALGVRTAPYRVISSEADLAAVPEAIGWPCVVKPTTAGRGRGVTTDVADMEHLLIAVRHAAGLAKGPVFVERQVEGDIFRINVIRGNVTIIRRLGIAVTGDGKQTIEQLIAASNRASEARRAADRFAGPIEIDGTLLDQLSVQFLGLDDVPENGRVVTLNRNATRAQGGLCADATPEAHPDIGRMARMLASALGLEVCGIDYISSDISRSCAEEGAVLEINTTPGLRIAQFIGMPAEELGRRILGDGPGRIPVSLILAEQADLERLARELRFGERQGWVIAPDFGLGSMSLANPNEPGAPARAAELVLRILRNPLAEGLTIVCTPAQLMEAGLPVDRIDRVISCRASLDPAWLGAMKATTGEWIDSADADEAIEARRRAPGAA